MELVKHSADMLAVESRGSLLAAEKPDVQACEAVHYIGFYHRLLFFSSTYSYLPVHNSKIDMKETTREDRHHDHVPALSDPSPELRSAPMTRREMEPHTEASSDRTYLFFSHPEGPRQKTPSLQHQN
jgi:hypothetical protein